MGFSPKCSADLAYFGGVHNSKPYLWYIFMHRDTYDEIKVLITNCSQLKCAVSDDLIICYRIAFSLVDVNFDDFYSIVLSSQHEAIRLNKYHSDVNAKDQFSQRIITVWNSLSSDAVDFGTLRSFKRTIKLVDFSQFLKCFNHKSHLRVCCLYIGIYVCVCVWAAVSAGLSLAVPACLYHRYVIVTVLDELNE